MKTSCINPLCEGTTFEFEEIEPTESGTVLLSVQCSECGTPIAVMPSRDPVDVLQPLIEAQEPMLDGLVERLIRLEKTVDMIFDLVVKTRP